MPQTPQANPEVERTARQNYNARRVREQDRTSLLTYSAKAETLKRQIIDDVEAEYMGVARSLGLTPAEKERALMGMLERKIKTVTEERLSDLGITDDQAVEYMKLYLSKRQDWFIEDGQTHYGQFQVGTQRGDTRGERVDVELPKWNYRTETPNWSFGMFGSDGAFVDGFLEMYEAREMEKERQAARQQLAQEQQATQQQRASPAQERLQQYEDQSPQREQQIETQRRERAAGRELKRRKRNDRWRNRGQRLKDSFSYYKGKIAGGTLMALGGLYATAEVGAPYSLPYSAWFNSGVHSPFGRGEPVAEIVTAGLVGVGLLAAFGRPVYEFFKGVFGRRGAAAQPPQTPPANGGQQADAGLPAGDTEAKARAAEALRFLKGFSL